MRLRRYFVVNLVLIASLLICPQITTGADYTLVPLAKFNYLNGAHPTGDLISDGNGNIYGVTRGGGLGDNPGYGTVYKYSISSNTITTVAAFQRVQTGIQPLYSGVYLDADGNIYGTTRNGPNIAGNGDGTVFEVAAGTGAISTLVTFNGANGQYPESGLFADANGNLYGTTFQGGASSLGTIFKIAAGTHDFTTIASFDGTTGILPTGRLVIDLNGNLFGTASNGGFGRYGAVFELAAGTNTLTSLVDFSGANGKLPLSGLTTDAAGNLYGVTSSGGLNSYGSVFKIDAVTHAFTSIASFNLFNGAGPIGSLVVDTVGNIFGTTSSGVHSRGTVFEIPVGTNEIHTIAQFQPGDRPETGLYLAPNGDIFGTLAGAGTVSDRGEFFMLTTRHIPEASSIVLATVGISMCGIPVVRRMRASRK